MGEVMEIAEPLAGSRSDLEGMGTALEYRTIWKSPMSGASRRHQFKFFNRLALSIFRRKLLSIQGGEIIQCFRQPYSLVANHSVKYEALLLPAVVNFLREGHPIHFMADWNFRLWPLVGHLMVLGESITVARKPAKPAILNVLRPLYVGKNPPMDQARIYLEKGEPVGIFPEGTANANAGRLLRGDRGAAWLSLQTRVPLLPVGIRFRGNHPDWRIQEFSPMEIEFGQPMFPEDRLEDKPSDLETVKHWHEAMMKQISELCRKNWNPQTKRKKYESD
jgi:1-acyl-sn-glycerol-3-phosphate acyltransferase